jgi:hypothetical protein
VRTCSVCDSEIDKTTAYTVSGEQKPQGRRCVNCVDSTKKVVSTPVQVAPTPTTKADIATQTDASGHDQKADGGNSKLIYIGAAIAVIVVLWALQ